MENITCVRVSDLEVKCDGDVYVREHFLGARDALFWVYLVVYVALVLFAGKGLEKSCRLATYWMS